jgi:hypothetical protein
MGHFENAWCKCVTCEMFDEKLREGTTIKNQSVIYANFICQNNSDLGETHSQV